MQKYFEELMSRLMPALGEAAKDTTPLVYYTASVRLLENATADLKTQIQANPFPGIAEEIRFFRDQAPELHSRLFYFLKLARLESCRPYASQGMFKELLQRELQESEQFFLRHADF